MTCRWPGAPSSRSRPEPTGGGAPRGGVAEGAVFLSPTPGARFAGEQDPAEADGVHVAADVLEERFLIDLFFGIVYPDKGGKDLSGRKVFVIARLDLRQDQVAKLAVENQQFEQVAFGNGYLGTGGTRDSLGDILRVVIGTALERAPEFAF